MFLKAKKPSHRAKLTSFLTIAISIALAVVFFIVIAIVRDQALTRKFEDLERNVKRVSNEWSGPASLVEEHEDFPHVEFTVFTQDGSVAASTIKKPLQRFDGRRKVENLLFFGIKHNDVEIVGATSWIDTESGLRQLGMVLACLWLPLTILTALVAWYGGGLVLRPVTELVCSADNLSASSKTNLLETSDEAEFATLANSLNLMISRVRKASEVQEQFASDAAHELRSPLALLRARVETTLVKARDAAEYQETLRSVLGQAERLTTIVETLLASARESHRLDHGVNLEQSVREIVDQWRQDACWNKNRLDVKTEPCLAMISEDELRIVLTNLLDNAARFSPFESPIVVRVTGFEDSSQLTVRDFGPGISKEDQPRVFDRFYRVEEDRNRTEGGAGIGLSVVKKIIESRKGHVKFVEVNQGTLITLTFPNQLEEWYGAI